MKRRVGPTIGQTLVEQCNPIKVAKLVVLEVRHQEEATGCAKAISQARQGQRLKWESIEIRKVSWKDLCEMKASRISVLLRAT